MCYFYRQLLLMSLLINFVNIFQVLCNGAICSIVMIGAVIQSLVLGNLRPVEHVQFRERLWNWVIYKFIFMFIILKAYTLDKVALWLFWYSTLGFLHLMTSLCKDRFEYVSMFFYLRERHIPAYVISILRLTNVNHIKLCVPNNSILN